MDGLFDKQNRLITKYVGIIPRKDTIKVENRLLDGSFHIQIMGSAATILDTTLYAHNETVKERIDKAEASGELLRVALKSKYWDGIIREPLSWQKSAGTYKTSFEFLVTDSGNL